MQTIEIVGRSNCIICDSRANAYLCDDCANESREDFFLLILSIIKDNSESFESVRMKCMEISNILDTEPIVDATQMFFDPRVHTIDNHAQNILETSTDIVTSNTKAVEVYGDGDCGFHSFQIFYPSVNVDEIRTRVIVELSAHEQFYNSLASQHGLDLVDDESVQDHVLRILNKGEYAGILTLSALASVFGRVVQSVYPNINGKDQYTDILNTNFQPRSMITSEEVDALPLRVLWSGPEAELGRDWRPNHFVPLLYTRDSGDTTLAEHNSSISKTTERSASIETQPDMVKFRTLNERNEMNMIRSETKSRSSYISTTFLSATDIIERIVHSNKSNLLDVPPKMVSKSSIYIIKNSDENRCSIGKDGLGVWVQDRSKEVPLVLSDKGIYQLVQLSTNGQWFYNKRIGNKYMPQFVDDNAIFLLKR